MASLTFPVLVLAAICIFHTESGDAKAMPSTRDKRAPNFFAYPRQGRAMNFFHWPRQGKRADGKIDETCCSEGIISIYSETGKKTYCNGIQCCEGLEKRFEEVDNNLSKEGQSVLVACIPEEFGDSQIHAAS